MDRTNPSTLSSNINEISDSTKSNLLLLLFALFIFILGIIVGMLIITTTRNSSLDQGQISTSSSSIK